MDDHNPVQQACRVLQSHWQHIAGHAAQIHGHVGTHLQLLRASSSERPAQSHIFRRRQDAL